MTLTTCTSCIPNHYTDCNTCFGFGIYYSRGHNIPIDPDESISNIIRAEPCPECGSTLDGIPTPIPPTQHTHENYHIRQN